MHPPSPHLSAFLAAMACASCTASLAAQERQRDVTTAVPVAPQQAADPAAAAIERAGIIVVGGRTGTTGADAAARTPAPTPP